MNTYEKHIHQEIKDWEEEKKGYIAETANAVVLSAFSYTGSFIPTSFVNALTATVEASLRSCFSGSLYTTSKQQIVQQANKLYSCEAKCLSELKHLELEQLDLLAASYCNASEVMAVLEGAGMGLGGLMFMAADIPALIMINMRALIQLAFIFGIDATLEDEREFILNVMTLAAADDKEKLEILQHLDTMARSNAQKQLLRKQLQDHIVGEAMTRVVHVAHKVAVRLTHAKLLQMVPIVGSAVGAGANFFYTREIINYGLMVFRKRWLTTKYNLPPNNLLILAKSANAEQLLTSWVLISEDSEEEEEFEEDFRGDNDMQVILRRK